MEVTKFNKDHTIGCTYGFSITSGIFIRIWKVNPGLPKYTPIKNYGYDMEEWILEESFGKFDGLTPDEIQMLLEQYGFQKIGAVNFRTLSKQHKVMIEAQEEYNKNLI